MDLLEGHSAIIQPPFSGWLRHGKASIYFLSRRQTSQHWIHFLTAYDTESCRRLQPLPVVVVLLRHGDREHTCLAALEDFDDIKLGDLAADAEAVRTQAVV